MGVKDFTLRVRRAETPFYAGLKRFALAVLGFQLPIPRFLDPIYRGVLHFLHFKYEISEKFRVATFRYPIFRTMCTSVGRRLRMELIPSVSGHPRIYIGDDVHLSGTVIFNAGRVFAEPEVRIGNRTFVGHGTSFTVAKSLEVGDDVLIAGGCWISDYSQHPLDPEKRIAGVQVDLAEVRPVRIGHRVWVGSRAIVLPGVTIGDDAVIGAATVVTKDVPPGSICVGNPGRILSRTVYDPKPERLVNTT